MAKKGAGKKPKHPPAMKPTKAKGEELSRKVAEAFIEANRGSGRRGPKGRNKT